jgi:phosphoenolpyruvate-protein phosphotransferase/dihydroxyacetone kinase phosphotransfer subunit
VTIAGEPGGEPGGLVALVLVSHVAGIAGGIAELVAQMAPDVPVVAAGGTDDGGIGTSFDRVLSALDQAEHGVGAVVLYDLGSALLTAESALDLIDENRRNRIRVVDAPFVEGALAAAVAAQSGASIDDVARAAELSGAASRVDGSSYPAAPEASPAGSAKRGVFRLPNPLGLHLRPAALLVRALSGLDAQVQLGRPGGPRTDARSLLGVVGTGLRGGELVEVVATGPATEDALEAVRELVEDGFSELEPGRADEREEPAQREGRPEPAPRPGDFVGLGVSPGTAAGPTLRLLPSEVDASSLVDRDCDPVAQQRRLLDAVERVRRELNAAGGGVLSDAHALLLDDTALREPAVASMAAGGSAEYGWWQAIAAVRAVLAAGDEIAAGRAADVLDIGLRVLAELDPTVVTSSLPPAADLRGAVVIADDVLPSQVPQLVAAGVAGLVTARGSRTAHASLVARGLGLPMVVAVDANALDLPDRTAAVVDAEAGTVTAPASADQVQMALQRGAAERDAREAAAGTARQPVVLADGRRVAVGANVGTPAEARAALQSGADTIGLLRTEMLFLGKRDLPDEDEQVARLSEVLAEFPGRSVTIRTLDVGGDKLLPALRLDPRLHGFLGLRGLRYGLAHPDLLRTHLRAVLRAAANHDGEFALMAPMVTYAEEVRAFTDLVEAAAAELDAEELAHRRPDALGIMVEVPAAALAIDEVAAGLDFVSIGTNDLLQYLAAAERTLPEVAGLYRPSSTAVWRILELVVAGARRAGVTVSVCGEIAEDPASAQRLVQLGVRELSVPPSSVALVKAALRPPATPQAERVSGGDAGRAESDLPG